MTTILSLSLLIYGILDNNRYGSLLNYLDKLDVSVFRLRANTLIFSRCTYLGKYQLHIKYPSQSLL
jgi:hypothetical protein